ncbi:MAG: MFS transporter [Pusillimonas sp.]|nr:MFS transporter [Pusillimonas sp.]MBC43922.1 MFS transporter [Pusillimonas sp.]HCP79638.1 MFS transporter [Pusillimonas sp.]|tara:strand:+ start:158663 stop:159802 length:1140 start_codon:yes stop_codon:yes gene_type:complete
MATAIGGAVASNYYVQPLLDSIAAEYAVSYTSVGIIVTVAQIGYGAGLLLLVPLGDKLEKRNLICIMTLISASGLLISGLSPSLPFLLLGTAITALFSVVTQLLIPFGAQLARPEVRGRIVGVLMSGLLMGILLGRTISGGLSAFGSWRIVYFVAAAFMSVVAVLLWKLLPQHRNEKQISYVQLLLSIRHLFATEPVLRSRSLMGALSFGLFTLFWTPLSFLLSAPPYGFSDAIIGLFGLTGAAGALSASWAGRLADKGRTNWAVVLGLVMMLVSWVPIGFSPVSIIALIVGVVFLDFAVQLVHVSNMNSVIKLDPEQRSRLNASYMTAYFVGGASGSFLAALIYQNYGWMGITITGLAVSLLLLVLGLHDLQRERRSG